MYYWPHTRKQTYSYFNFVYTTPEHPCHACHGRLIYFSEELVHELTNLFQKLKMILNPIFPVFDVPPNPVSRQIRFVRQYPRSRKSTHFLPRGRWNKYLPLSIPRCRWGTKPVPNWFQCKMDSNIPSEDSRDQKNRMGWGSWSSIDCILQDLAWILLGNQRHNLSRCIDTVSRHTSRIDVFPGSSQYGMWGYRTRRLRLQNYRRTRLMQYVSIVKIMIHNLVPIWRP